MTRHRLFPLAELAPGSIRPARVDGVDVVVVRTDDGRVHALRDRCAHSGARLSHGKLLPRVDGEDVDCYTITDEFVLRCPWHGYEYGVDDGRCLADPERVRVRSYPVLVEDGAVWLER